MRGLVNQPSFEIQKSAQTPSFKGALDLMNDFSRRNKFTPAFERYPDSAQSFSEKSRDAKIDQIGPSEVLIMKPDNIPPECIEVRVRYTFNEKDFQELKIVIHPERKFIDLLDLCISKLSESYEGLSTSNTKFLLNSVLIPNEYKLSQKIKENDQVLDLLVCTENVQSKAQHLPTPRLVAQSTQIKNFTFENKHGKIVFDGYTDPKNLDIPSILKLTPSCFEIYPCGTYKPKPGKGLNKPCTVTLYNMPVKLSKTQKSLLSSMATPSEQAQFRRNISKEFARKLRAKVEEDGGEFIGYDEAKGHLHFRHNTKGC